MANAEKMRPLLRAQPDAHYTSSKVFVQGDDAVLLGQIGEEQFLSMRLVKEDGLWKIKDQVWSDKPYHRGLGLCHDSAARRSLRARGGAVAERRTGIQYGGGGQAGLAGAGNLR